MEKWTTILYGLYVCMYECGRKEKSFYSRKEKEEKVDEGRKKKGLDITIKPKRITKKSEYLEILHH